MTFPATGRKVEVIILSEVGEIGQDKNHIVSLLGGILKWRQMNFFTKEKQPHRLMVPNKKFMVPKEEKRRAEENELVQIYVYTLLFIKSSTRTHCIAQGTLLNTP